MPNKAMYEGCVDLWYRIEPISYFKMGENIIGEKGCYQGPTAYRAPGYLEGVGLWALIHRGGYERVYDFARMEGTNFNYYGSGGNDAIDAGIGGMFYVGKVWGFRSDESIDKSYKGLSSSYSLGPSMDIGFGIGAGQGGFISWSDPMLRGKYYYAGGSWALDLAEGVDVDVTIWAIYSPVYENPERYATNGEVNRSKLYADILSGKGSPMGVQYPSLTAPANNVIIAARLYGVSLAKKYADVYEELRKK